MSRNEDKLGPPAQVDALPPTQMKQEMRFPEPSTFVELPTEGLYYPATHPLHLQRELEIRFMTAAEEDILANQAYIKKGVVMEKLLRSIIKNRAIDISTLFVADRNAIAIEARSSGFGSDYTTQVICPACGEKVKYKFDLNNFTVIRAGKEIMSETGNFKITMPKTNAVAECRLLTGADELWLQQMLKNKKAKQLPETPLLDIMTLFIVSINDNTDKSLIMSFLSAAPAQDTKFLRKSYSDTIPRIDTEQAFSCSACGHEAVMEVPLGSQFFWPE